MATNALRMSGLNSGLDTEAIVNALTAATKNKINKNQRSILQLQAQQDAYRTIINKFNTFKDKYFDILNVNTCLKSKTMFGSFKSTLTSSTGTNYVPGVTVSSNSTANPGSYKVKVDKVATQATRTSNSDTGKAFDFESVDPGSQYTMKVTVGEKSKFITFTAGNTEEQTMENINEALKEKFGVTNSGKGLVSMDSDGKFSSTDKSAVVFTSPALYQTSFEKDISGLETGNNSFTITVDGEQKTVSFSTIEEDYFDLLFDTAGNLLTEEELEDRYGEDGYMVDEDNPVDLKDLKSRLALYKQVVLNQREGEVYDSFDKWWNGVYNEETDTWESDPLSDDDKKAFADWIAQNQYEKALADLEKDYNTELEAKAKLAEYNEYLDNLGEDEEKLSFNQYFEDKYGEDYDFSSEIEAYKDTEEGQKITEKFEKNLQKLDDKYQGLTDKAKQKEITNSYNDYFKQAKEAAKREAYDEAVAEGKISDYEEDENYVSFEDFKDFTFTKADFEATDEDGNYLNSFYEDHLWDVENEIEPSYTEGYHTVDLDSLSKSQLVEFYDEYVDAYDKGIADKDDYINNYVDYISQEAKDFGAEQDYDSALIAAREAVYQFNKSNIENNLEGLKFGATGRTRLDVDYGRDGSLSIKGVLTTLRPNEETGLAEWVDVDTEFAITANEGSKNNFGFSTTDVTGTASRVSTTSTLDELGIEPDAKGKYTFSINGMSFSFSGDTTISDMMKQINASTAGVKMSYSTLNNQFTFTANEYGTGVEIDLQDGNGVLAALGFVEDPNTGELGTFEGGTNTELWINDEYVETSSNSYTMDGTTFTFTQAAEGQEFTNEVTRDYSKAMDAIKSFVEDYNKLIEDIYGYVDEEPNKDYYFLTDDDIDEMGLSESQQNKWEKMAQKGVLYRDSTLTDIMSKLRTVLYNSVDAADGKKVGLYTLGITTSSDYSNHGKLIFDDTVDFEAMFEQYADEITELFTNSETGIASQFEKIIDNATRTTGAAGERGTLVDKAGVSGTSSATSNTIYNKIKSLQDMIATLQARYDQQQDRYWKIYGNMETMLGNLNSQTSYINQLLGNY